ncbi:MAG TPA: DUF488 domain-containing protein [Pyrinomonadaceae bacterium]|jgi:uncharacterized protein (DUF488 family)|nr:DUF488 domain-containing protein [Pyrinomonadaceae bacterium]
MRVYTLGYEGLSPELYVKALVNAGVGVLIDVRERAWSQRPAFVKSTLARSLQNVGISYLHFPRAGNPSQNRKTARSAAECMSRYRQYLQGHRGCVEDILVEIRLAAEGQRYACLACYEHDFENCHRGVLAEELVGLAANLSVYHLAPTAPAKKLKTHQPSVVAASTFLHPTLFPLT